MRRTRVKICGLTRAEDVVAAVDAGADACGFIFASSPRRVGIERAAELATLVPPSVARVGVFADAEHGFVEDAIRECRLSSVQFSGSEPPEACSAVPVPVIKVIPVGADFGWSSAKPYRGHVAALLLDTYDPHRAGGTSRTFAWHEIGELPGWAPCFVAGGLSPENVASAVRALKPFGVDASSRLESAPGVKDHARVRAFLSSVRGVDSEVYP